MNITPFAGRGQPLTPAEEAMVGLMGDVVEFAGGAYTTIQSGGLASVLGGAMMADSVDNAYANIETIRQRLETYDHETRPVLNFYGSKLVHTIDATQSPINVLRDILRVIAKT